MTANRPYDDEDDLNPRGFVDRRADPNRADREISLGTPTILGIFFALALVCACFFGFGYSMGHRSAQATEPTAYVQDPASGVSVSAPKPSAGSASAQSTVVVAKATNDTPPAQAVVQTTPTPPAAAKNAATPADGAIVGDKIPPPPPQLTTNNQQPAPAFMVQVAAVSTQDIADIEVAALKKQGFDVVVRHEPQDKLLHVQIGPFTDRKDAVAMQQRVLADGFNAIVK